MGRKRKEKVDGKNWVMESNQTVAVLTLTSADEDGNVITERVKLENAPEEIREYIEENTKSKKGQKLHYAFNWKTYSYEERLKNGALKRRLEKVVQGYGIDGEYGTNNPYRAKPEVLNFPDSTTEADTLDKLSEKLRNAQRVSKFWLWTAALTAIGLLIAFAIAYRQYKGGFA